MEQRLMCMAAWLLQRFRLLMIWDVLRLCSMRGKTIRSSGSNHTEKQMPKQETLMKGNIIHRRPTPHTRYHIYLFLYKNTTNNK